MSGVTGRGGLETSPGSSDLTVKPADCDLGGSGSWYSCHSPLGEPVWCKLQAVGAASYTAAGVRAAAGPAAGLGGGRPYWGQSSKASVITPLCWNRVYVPSIGRAPRTPRGPRHKHPLRELQLRLELSLVPYVSYQQCRAMTSPIAVNGGSVNVLYFI